MRLYATESQVEAFTGEPAPENVAVLLRFASTLVAAATRGDLYDTDPAGMPTDPDVVDAFADATCCQVGVWAAAGVDPSAGEAGVEAQVTSSKILDAQVGYDGATVGAARRSSVVSLAPVAYQILRNAGLASSAVSTGE